MAGMLGQAFSKRPTCGAKALASILERCFDGNMERGIFVEGTSQNRLIHFLKIAAYMDTLAKRKDSLLKVIASLQQDEWILAIERLLAPLMQNQNKAFIYAKPIAPTLNLEHLAEQQHYHAAKSVLAFGSLPCYESFSELLGDLKA
jgi:hypothetical protein